MKLSPDTFCPFYRERDLGLDAVDGAAEALEWINTISQLLQSGGDGGPEAQSHQACLCFPALNR